MPKIDIANVPVVTGSGYPKPWCNFSSTRTKRRLGDAAGLSAFGVNLTTLPPGEWSSQRHWHSREEEFVYVLEGQLTLITGDGEAVLKAGECAGFKAGVADGHHFINRGSVPAVYLEVGSRVEDDHCSYPDIDLDLSPGEDGKPRFCHKDGTPY